MVFLYTMVIILASILGLWCFWKNWREPSPRDYGRMVGDEDVPNRLWFDENDLQPGGVWEAPGSPRDDDQVSGEFTASESRAGTSEDERREVQLLQARARSHIYRPGQGSARVGRISTGERRREEDAARMDTRSAPSSSEAMPGIVRRRLRGDSSSATFEGSDSEVALSADTEGRVRIRSRATRDVETGEASGTLETSNPSSGTTGPSSGGASAGSTLEHPGQAQGLPVVMEQEPSGALPQGDGGGLLRDGGNGGSASGASTRQVQPGPAVASFLEPERMEIFYAATGQVYHLRRNCGKLKAAKRIFRQSNCLICAAQAPNGRSLKLDRDVYHDVNGCSSSITNWLRPCHECGGG